MIAKLVPHPDQIRYFAQNALNSFETLDFEDAVENAIWDLKAILRYLDQVEAAEAPAFTAKATDAASDVRKAK